jgi:LPPG:FO 2-phospho-L-lactate transferase
MASSNLGIICGGSGSSKFVTALKSVLLDFSFTPLFVANVADNFWHYGLYICPDVDILMYSLADILDVEKGWGIKGDSTNFVKSYAIFHRQEAWFNLGDADLALSLRRTELINKGWKLSRITQFFQELLQIKQRVIPATDDEVQTFIRTSVGIMHLQEFWVKNKGLPVVRGVEYRGCLTAKASNELLSAVSHKVLILPANPVSSVLPTLKLTGVKDKLRKAGVVIAISPFLGKEPFSGPAAKFMHAIGAEHSSFGVAKLYSQFLKIFVVDSTEETHIFRRIRDLGIECVKANIRIKTSQDKKRIVNEIIHLL